ncbi:hypothetical protein C444_20866 [Haloarcula japonica DSM 6131]|uniref:Uncharacterized protein n=1 Tax=Haloarcula japonica (strain ATCC 49778 / DSM 6131 / JCM 7785 / NBRC 101032 / NCIMB 13157 / TR-1) TaxID=1227453 RepID=M0L3R8_HALJT|nr:hypothetical protein C444_20866 [Haloarcula japonica DSM 6131]
MFKYVLTFCRRNPVAVIRDVEPVTAVYLPDGYCDIFSTVEGFLSAKMYQLLWLLLLGLYVA